MQIGAKGIEILLMTMVLRKYKKKTQIQKYTFPFLFTWESPN
jgi:hypothetical protein